MSETLQSAVIKHPPWTAKGLAERAFIAGFRGFVYNQIWEDPRVDLAAMKLGPEDRVLTISSGGCNVLNYLTQGAGPAEIHAVDLNANHMALTRLKVEAARRLPGYENFWRMFGTGKDPANVEAYNTWVKAHLDGATRRFWEGSIARRLARRSRIRWFSTSGLYKKGALGMLLRYIHLTAKLFIPDFSYLKRANSIEEQTRFFETYCAPFLQSRFIKFLADTPFGCIGLGIPPHQRQIVEEEYETDFLSIALERARRLVTGFPLGDSYFLHMCLFGEYDTENRQVVPDYLRENHFDTLRDRVGRVKTRVCSTVDYMRERGPDSLDAFVLLDSMDWMTSDQVADQFNEISRVGTPGARIIFRTGGRVSPVEKSLPAALLRKFRYHAEESERLHAQDRAAIYGGFHLYTLEK